MVEIFFFVQEQNNSWYNASENSCLVLEMRNKLGRKSIQCYIRN
jgi:hypothetical protein